MQKGALPAVVSHKGRPVQKPKLSLAARVANNSQKKIETLNRWVRLNNVLFVAVSNPVSKVWVVIVEAASIPVKLA